MAFLDAFFTFSSKFLQAANDELAKTTTKLEEEKVLGPLIQNSSSISCYLGIHDLIRSF